ncbi:MAG: hypothetical protein ACNA8W_12410, partial [Bradymonadaceae bacterium]
MTSIDEVVARSRQPGGFSEHKRFTLARSRGIQKMRQFALADPHYYVLELIQASVANGATYIDIQCERSSVALSYVGGGYHESQLGQLFDFLFASREDVEHGDLRLLALGINALMLFEPAEIVIESGDGTLKGTTRVVIKGREDVVEVGTPQNALKGTYIRASGMNRRKIARRSSLENHELGPPECRAIEDRCITAPVPILVNGHPIFGYSSQRTPKALFGMRRTQVFDEGDLYGAVGLAARPSGATFRLVTHGVWIQSVTHEDFSDIGGVISFDRLRKTADHAGIVQDGRYDEMWLRLQPYSYQLRSDRRKASDIGLLEGEPRAAHEVIALVREAGGGVFVEPGIRSDPRQRDHALAIGHALSLPIVTVPWQQRDTLMGVAGPDALTIRPDFNDDEEVAFYQQAEAEAPPRPWLLEPRELDHLPLEWLAEWIASETVEPAALPLEAEGLEGSGSAKVTIYTPAESEGHEQELRVEIRTASRLVWSGWFETAYPGHVVVVELPNMAPGVLREPMSAGSTESLAELIAGAIVRHASHHFERASRQSLAEFVHREIAPGTVAARIILAALARQSIKRLRSRDEGHAQVLLSSVDRRVDPRLWDIPVLETHTGRSVSLRGLSEMLEATMGFVYGTVPEVEPDLEGLDLDLVLKLDLHTERILITLLGEAAYIRVDCRDVLASYHGARCRDIALGLREYGEFPLLVEGARPEMWNDEEKSRCVSNLVEELMRVLQDGDLSLGVRENRRQALRHLRWFVVWQQRYGGVDGDWELLDYPLFACANGEACSLRQVLGTFARGGRLRMLDGVSYDLTQRNGLWFQMTYEEQRQREPQISETLDLAMNPYVFNLLSALGTVHGGADFELFEAEAKALRETQGQAFIETAAIDEASFEGMIGLPLMEAAHPAIMVVSEDRSQVYLMEEIAQVYGLVGILRLRRSDVEPEELESAVREAAQTLLHDLATG